MANSRVAYVLSAALHVALGTAVAAVRPKPVRETVTVTVRDVRRARPTPAPPPAPPEAPTEPAAAAASPSPAPPTPAPHHGHAHARAHAPTPAPSAAPSPSPSASGAPDFGVSLGNDGGGGVAVPGGGGGGGGGGDGGDARPAAHASHEDECADAPVRPRVLEMPEPEYPDAARDESIEGRVRVELSLDDGGRVVRARVLQGLGHGLDEAALAAARGARFEPATRCGRAVATTFTVAIRFAL